jgi:hypothetical protein
MSMSRGGRVVGTGDYRPVCLTSRPNGPECEPVCVGAGSDTLLVDP